MLRKFGHGVTRLAESLPQAIVCEAADDRSAASRPGSRLREHRRPAHEYAHPHECCQLGDDRETATRLRAASAMDVWHTCPRASARPEGNFEGTREIVLTREGLARLEGELEQLATVRRREVAERISEALETGAELAENAEYLAAKEEQGRLEQRIAQLEERRAAATVVEAADVPSDSVAVGSRVRPKDPDAGETAEYEIVGSGEGSPTEGRLSSESPVGSAILDRHEGEVVEIEAPGGRRRLQILDVNPA